MFFSSRDSRNENLANFPVYLGSEALSIVFYAKWIMWHRVLETMARPDSHLTSLKIAKKYSIEGTLVATQPEHPPYSRFQHLTKKNRKDARKMLYQ